MRVVVTNKEETLLYGYIEYDINMENREVCIKDFLIYEQCRGKGYGRFLLTKFYNYILKNYKNKVDKIELVDCSERYNNKNNIYLKFGFNYVQLNEPDMEIKINKNSKYKEFENINCI